MAIKDAILSKIPSIPNRISCCEKFEEKKINYRTDNIYDFKVSQEFKQMFSDTPLSTNYAGIDDYINEKTKNCNVS